jgi:hypothetical protein
MTMPGMIVPFTDERPIGGTELSDIGLSEGDLRGAHLAWFIDVRGDDV